MKGLLLKDLLNLKKQAKIYLFLFGFYLAFGIIAKDASFFSGVIMILCAMLPITALSYDERAKWDKYALTMPISRKHMVLSKYALGILFTVFGFIILLLVNSFVEMSFKETIGTSLIIFGGSIFFISLIMPILFKFGVEKGRMLMMLVLFLPAAIIILIGNFSSKLPTISPKFLEIAMYVSPIIILMLLALSIILSLRIYQKKEF